MADETPKFRTDFDPRHGQLVELVPGLARLTAPNASAFTFHGTNTYLLGRERLAVIDPGPEIDGHFEALMAAIGGRTVSHIVLTHTHVDHSPLAARLKAATGAPTHAEGPHRPSRPLELGEVNPLDASGDTDFVPDHVVAHGDIIEGDGWALKAIATPGHTANHMAFGWVGTDHLLSGDHVMGWSTSIVAPPDGAMADYMASLEVLLAEPQTTYWPGHGGRVENAHAFVRALRAHRKMRETAVLDQVRKGHATVPDMVAVIYRTTDKRLHGAAGLSVLAHLEDLVARGRVKTDGRVALDATFIAAD